ncbi:MAG: signal peptidase II, partial [Candidatus Andersenbacteria bacterium]
KTDFVQTQQQQRSSYKRAFLLFISFLLGIRIVAYFSDNFSQNNYYNKGLAFSLVENNVLLYIVTILGIFCLLFLSQRISPRFTGPILLIFAGGISNILDRVLYGAVIDPITIGSWQGNVADIAIFFGIFCIGWGMITQRDTPTHASTH